MSPQNEVTQCCLIKKDTILYNNEVLGSGKLCMLDAFPMNTDIRVAASASSGSEKLWHERYGHLNRESLKILLANELVNGINFSQMIMKT